MNFLGTEDDCGLQCPGLSPNVPATGWAEGDGGGGGMGMESKGKVRQACVWESCPLVVCRGAPKAARLD